MVRVQQRLGVSERRACEVSPAIAATGGFDPDVLDPIHSGDRAPTEPLRAPRWPSFATGRRTPDGGGVPYSRAGSSSPLSPCAKRPQANR